MKEITHQIRVHAFGDDVFAVFAIVIVGVAAAVVEIRRLLDDDRLAGRSAQPRRQQLEPEVVTPRRRAIVLPWTDEGSQADVAPADGGLGDAGVPVAAEVDEIIAGVQLLEHEPQHVEIVGPHSLIGDHLLDAVSIEQQLHGSVGDVPPATTDAVIVAIVVAQTTVIESAFLLKTATQNVAVLRDAAKPGSDMELGWDARVHRDFHHAHVHGVDVLGPMSPGAVLLDRETGG